MNNTESRYNGLNNAISRKRRHNPLIAVPALIAPSDPKSAAELSGSGGQEEEVDEDSVNLSPEPTANVATAVNPEATKTPVGAVGRVENEAEHVFSKDKEQEIEPAILRTSFIDNTKSGKTKSEPPVKKINRKFNPFLIDS
jgi:hypothetical protein